MRISICDDNEQERAEVRLLLQEYLTKNSYSAHIFEFSSAQELLQQKSPSDLYILDILMPETNGIELGKTLRKTQSYAFIIYLTNTHEFAFDAFSVKPFAYLIKPAQKDDFFKEMDLYFMHIKRFERKIKIRTKDSDRVYNLNDIIAVEYYGHKLIYHTTSDRFEGVSQRESFDIATREFVETKSFIKISASFIINVHHIKRLGHEFFFMDNGSRFKVTRRYATAKKQYMDFVLHSETNGMNAYISANNKGGGMTFNLIQNITSTYALVFAMFLNVVLIPPRIPLKKYAILSGILMGIVTVANMSVAFISGTEAMSRFSFYSISIPSFLYFLIMAKHRDGRTIFAFCFGDMTILAEGYICGMICAILHYNPWVLLFSRLFIFPISVFFMWKYLRKFYLKVAEENKDGWYLISIVAVIYYLLLMILGTTPTPIIQRPEDMLVMTSLIVAMALSFAIIFKTLATQLKIIHHERTEKLLELQFRALESTIKTMEHNENKMRIIRHDIRHYETAIRALAEAGDIEEIKRFVQNALEISKMEEVKKFCESIAINSVLSFYIELAAESYCDVKTNFSLASPLPVNDIELCIVFANAIENAINACRKIEDKGNRKIKITCVNTPQFALEIANTYTDPIAFDESGVPISKKKDHGYGTMSILAFVERHNAILDYDTSDGWFKLRMMLG